MSIDPLPPNHGEGHRRSGQTWSSLPLSAHVHRRSTTRRVERACSRPWKSALTTCCDARPADSLTATSPAGDVCLRSSHPDTPSTVQKPALSASAASDTRFKARQSFHDLLDGVRDIAIAATGGDASAAAHLSQGKWNRQRVLMGRLELPAAESVRQRMRKGCSWARTLELALAPTSQRMVLLNRLQSAPLAQGDNAQLHGIRLLSDRTALRSVFNVLHRSPSQVEYHAVARELDRQHFRKWNALRTRRPSMESIRQHFASWPAALSAAGLPPQSASHATITTGKDPVDILDRFIDENGFLPVEKYFLAWAREQAIPLPRAPNRKAFSAYVAQVRARREARRVWTPSQPMRRRNCPLLDPPGRRSPYTRDDRLRCLQRYGAHLSQTGRQPTARSYRAASARDPELMAYETLVQRGQLKFQDLCHEAGIA